MRGQQWIRDPVRAQPAVSPPEDAKLISESTTDGQCHGELSHSGEDLLPRGSIVLSPGMKSGGRYMAAPHTARQQVVTQRHSLEWPEAVVTLRLGAYGDSGACGCPQRLLLGSQELETKLGIWVQGDAAFSVHCLRGPGWQATDAPGTWRHQAVSDKQTYPLSSHFCFRQPVARILTSTQGPWTWTCTILNCAESPEAETSSPANAPLENSLAAPSP